MRRMLHLNRSCADAYIHTPIREGGLGVLLLRDHVPMILLRRLDKISLKGGDAARAVYNLPCMQKFCTKIRTWCGLHTDKNSINRYWAERLEVGYSGNGLRQGSSAIESGSWIYRPPLSGQEGISSKVFN